IVLLVMRMLRVELHVQERGLLLVGPGRDGEFLGAGRGVDSREERPIRIRDRAKRQARAGRACPDERDHLRWSIHWQLAQPRGGKMPCMAMMNVIARYGCRLLCGNELPADVVA